MPVFKREMKRNQKTCLIWSILMSLLMVLLMFMYPTIAEQWDVFEQLLDQYPKAFLAAFNVDRLSMGEILGYFGTEAYIFILLFGSIYAIQLASSIVSKEESEGTIEFLLSKPITRDQILTSKALCTLIYIFAFNLVVGLVTYICFEIVKEEPYDAGILFILFFGAFLVQLTFASIGLLLSIFIPKAKRIFPLSLGVVLGTYFLSVASVITEKLDWLKYLSPFKYSDAADIIINGGLTPAYLLIITVIILVCISMSYLFYHRKDINI